MTDYQMKFIIDFLITKKVIARHLGVHDGKREFWEVSEREAIKSTKEQWYHMQHTYKAELLVEVKEPPVKTVAVEGGGWSQRNFTAVRYEIMTRPTET